MSSHRFVGIGARAVTPASAGLTTRAPVCGQFGNPFDP